MSIIRTINYKWAQKLKNYEHLIVVVLKCEQRWWSFLYSFLLISYNHWLFWHQHMNDSWKINLKDRKILTYCQSLQSFCLWISPNYICSRIPLLVIFFILLSFWPFKFQMISMLFGIFFVGEFEQNVWSAIYCLENGSK